MKKLFLLLIMFMVIFTLASCKSNKTDEKKTDDPKQQEQGNKEKTEAEKAVAALTVENAPANPEYTYHAVGGWGAWDPVEDNNMTMTTVAAVKAFNSEIGAKLEAAGAQYVAFYVLEMGAKHGGFTAKAMDGEVKKEYDGCFTIKVIKSKWDEDSEMHLKSQWIPDPKTAHTESLTSNLFVPSWQEAADENGFSWADNSVVTSGAGQYLLIFADYGKASTAAQCGYGYGVVKLADGTLGDDVVPTTEVKAPTWTGYSVIGSFAGHNWDFDADLTEADGEFSITLELAEGDTIKVRKDHSWDKSYGYDALAENDGFGVADGNILIQTTGTYKVTFNESTGELDVELLQATGEDPEEGRKGYQLKVNFDDQEYVARLWNSLEKLFVEFNGDLGDYVLSLSPAELEEFKSDALDTLVDIFGDVYELLINYLSEAKADEEQEELDPQLEQLLEILNKLESAYDLMAPLYEGLKDVDFSQFINVSQLENGNALQTVKVSDFANTVLELLSDVEVEDDAMQFAGVISMAGNFLGAYNLEIEYDGTKVVRIELVPVDAESPAAEMIQFKLELGYTEMEIPAEDEEDEPMTIETVSSLDLNAKVNLDLGLLMYLVAGGELHIDLAEKECSLEFEFGTDSEKIMNGNFQYDEEGLKFDLKEGDEQLAKLEVGPEEDVEGQYKITGVLGDSSLIGHVNPETKKFSFELALVQEDEEEEEETKTNNIHIYGGFNEDNTDYRFEMSNQKVRFISHVVLSEADEEDQQSFEEFHFVFSSLEEGKFVPQAKVFIGHNTEEMHDKYYLCAFGYDFSKTGDAQLVDDYANDYDEEYVLAYAEGTLDLEINCLELMLNDEDDEGELIEYYLHIDHTDSYSDIYLLKDDDTLFEVEVNLEENYLYINVLEMFSLNSTAYLDDENHLEGFFVEGMIKVEVESENEEDEPEYTKYSYTLKLEEGELSFEVKNVTSRTDDFTLFGASLDLENKEFHAAIPMLMVEIEAGISDSLYYVHAFMPEFEIDLGDDFEGIEPEDEDEEGEELEEDDTFYYFFFELDLAEKSVELDVMSMFALNGKLNYDEEGQFIGYDLRVFLVMMADMEDDSDDDFYVEGMDLDLDEDLVEDESGEDDQLDDETSTDMEASYEIYTLQSHLGEDGLSLEILLSKEDGTLPLFLLELTSEVDEETKAYNALLNVMGVEASLELDLIEGRLDVLVGDEEEPLFKLHAAQYKDASGTSIGFDINGELNIAGLEEDEESGEEVEPEVVHHEWNIYLHEAELKVQFDEMIEITGTIEGLGNITLTGHVMDYDVDGGLTSLSMLNFVVSTGEEAEKVNLFELNANLLTMHLDVQLKDLFALDFDMTENGAALELEFNQMVEPEEEGDEPEVVEHTLTVEFEMVDADEFAELEEEALTLSSLLDMFAPLLKGLALGLVSNLFGEAQSAEGFIND